MDRQDLDGVWTVLSTTAPKAGVTVAPTGYQVAAGALLAGIDSHNQRHLLIPLLPGEAAGTDTKGRAVHLSRLAHQGMQYLTVVCLRAELHRVFTQFCRELAESVEDAASPAREAALAFDRWRALFSDANSFGQLSEEALVGLLGELLTLEQLLVRGAPAGLGYWAGPSGGVHDLRTVRHAIEVKTTLVREGRIVSISSIDQLQEPVGADLILQHIRLEHDPGGFDIAAIVSRLLAAGASYGDLARSLLTVGVSIDDLGGYAGRKYRLVESRSYDVNGAAFPRIVRSSFAASDVPPGTLHFNYAIDLTNEPPSPLTDEAAENILIVMAGEAAGEVDS